MLIIYGSEGCVFCTQAVKLAESKGIPYEYKDILEEQGMYAEFKAQGWRSVPQIFYKGNHIGGFTDFEKLLKQNNLG